MPVRVGGSSGAVTLSKSSQRPARLRAMENETISSVVPSVPSVEGPFEVAEELLVEEISIDGMCGVY